MKKRLMALALSSYIMLGGLNVNASEKITLEDAKLQMQSVLYDFGVNIELEELGDILIDEKSEDIPIYEAEFDIGAVSYDIVIDGNKKLRQFNTYGPSKLIYKNRLTNEDAKKIGDEIIKKNNPNTYDMLTLVSNEGGELEYAVVVDKFILDEIGSINISIDKRTKKVMDYRDYTSDIIDKTKIDRHSKVLTDSKEKLKSKLKSDFGVDLMDEFIKAEIDNELNTITLNDFSDDCYLVIDYDYKNDKIINFDYDDFKDDSNLNINEQTATNLATKFVDNQMSGIYEDVKLETIEKSSNLYDFCFAVLKDGVVIENVKIYVSVDSKNSKISSYRFENVDILEFEKVENLITQDMAKEELSKNIDVTTSYTCEFSEDEKLVYYINSSPVSAVTGKINSDDKKSNFKDISDDTKKEIAKNTYALTKIENEEMASKKAKEIVKDISNKDVTITDVYLSDYSDDNIYCCDFEGENNFIGSINIGENGDLVDYYTYDEEEGNVSGDKAYDMAIKVVAKYYPDKIMDINTNVDTHSEEDYDKYITFNRVFDGVEFEDDFIEVSIAPNGEIASISLSWSDINDSAFENIITKDKAKQIYLNNHDVKLVYMVDDEGVAKLCYIFAPNKDASTEIDAKTGQFLKY